MFFPHKLYGTNVTPSWPGNSGVDSNLGFVSDHGNSWENDKRFNGFAWVRAMGGDTTIFISEKLYGNIELQMFLTNRASPVDGHRMNDAENWVVKARTYGINRWIVSLFNDDSTCIPANKHDDYIRQMAECYAWATAEQVAWMICLETNERFPNVNDVIQRIEWCKQYSPGRRVIVGSAQPDFLKQVAASAKAQNLGIELWLETAWHPFQTSMANADSYLAALKDLMKSGPTWAGEFGNGSDPSVAYISKKAIEIGCVGIGSYNR
ncbi:MAG: hypothetical protein NT011_13520 [Kiritimatiellaeota bacterium]|nr:hypothetical protein [Kiritimatiellota bacterium]